MSEYLQICLWISEESLAAILLFDGFSTRKRTRRAHWSIVACFTILNSLGLILLVPMMTSFGKLCYSCTIFFLLHTLLYQSSLLFGLCITAIYYATLCCIDTLCASTLFLLFGASYALRLAGDFWAIFLIHFVELLIFTLLNRTRKIKSSKATGWKWYSVPALLSLANAALIFFLSDCFQNGQVSALPLFVCMVFITVLQTAAMFLVSWMEQSARAREETLSLQTRAQAQQESIEALSAAYARQRKLTHDFQVHLDTLAGLLAQETLDRNALQQYVQDLQASQTTRILLVNTHHTALDALLNQKALAEKKRSIDIQFSVNDLSAVKIKTVDLTILISNTLDNAIEACERLPEHDRQIFVKLLLEDNVLFYSVRNRSLPVEVPSGRLPTSTKALPTLHGYGLQNVQTTLKKYDSLYAVHYADGWFRFATDLPNVVLS